jgi:tetratricopeptide (TPR) repeat protein
VNGRPSFQTRLVWRLATLPLLLAAAGCAHDRSVPANAASPDRTSAAQPAPVVATPGLSPDARLDLAEDLLQKGDAEHAKVELEACLDEEPDSKAAKQLLVEIETPLSKLYPKQNFSVTLGRSETLSGLAATYLGDPLAFYGLARYNNIAQPAMIIAGQHVRIPATAEALAAQNGFVRGQAMAAADQAPQAQPEADQASAKSIPPAPAPAAKPAPPDPWSQFKSAQSHRQYSVAAKLADLNKFDPRNGRAAVLADTYMRAAASEKKTRAAAAHARKAGEIFLGILKQPEKARRAFQVALSLVPSDVAANAGLKHANDQVTEKYYRRGLIAFQHQDLDGAIAAWNIVLSIDPGYRDAQLNRDEAIQLKANLLKLKG